MVLRQLCQLPLTDVCWQRTAAAVQNHGPLQPAAPKYRIYKQRLLPQHPTSALHRVLHAGESIVQHVISPSSGRYKLAPKRLLMNVAYLTHGSAFLCPPPGGPLGTYWPLPHSQRQPSGPTPPVYSSGPQARVGPLQWICAHHQKLHPHLHRHQTRVVSDLEPCSAVASV